MTLYFDARIRTRCQVLLVMVSREDDSRNNQKFSIPSLEEMEIDSGTAEHRLFERSASIITQIQENDDVQLSQSSEMRFCM